MTKKEKILVLGSGSFIAQSTLISLVREGFSVVTVSRSTTNDEGIFEHYTGNCFDYQFLSKVVTEVNPDVILSFIGGSYTDGEYLNLVQLNCGVLELLSRMSLENVRIISLGSAAEYGAANINILVEDMEVSPTSDYGHAKAVQTALATGLNLELQQNVSILRVFNLYGVGTPSHAISEKIHQRVKRLPRGAQLVLDDPEMIRDFVDVKDVADGLVSFIQSNPVAGIYNLCSGQPLSLAQLAAAFLKVYGKNEEITVASEPKYFSPVRRAVGSTEKFLTATGWSPQRSLQDSVRAHVQSV